MGCSQDVDVKELSYLNFNVNVLRRKLVFPMEFADIVNYDQLKLVNDQIIFHGADL